MNSCTTAIWCFLCLFNVATAQTKFLTQSAVDLRTYTTEDGLPSDVTHDALQTQNGFIWIGTREGLVRFDGDEFVLVSTEWPEKMGRNVTRLAELAPNELTILCSQNPFGRGSGRLFHYNCVTSSVRPVHGKGDVPATMFFDNFKKYDDSTVILAIDKDTFYTFSRNAGIKKLQIPCLSNIAFAIAPNGTIWSYPGNIAEEIIDTIFSFNLESEVLEQHTRDYAFMGFNLHSRPVGFSENHDTPFFWIDTNGAKNPLKHQHNFPKPLIHPNAFHTSLPFMGTTIMAYQATNGTSVFLYPDQSFIEVLNASSGKIHNSPSFHPFKYIPGSVLLTSNNGFGVITLIENLFESHYASNDLRNNRSVRGITSDNDGNVYFTLDYEDGIRRLADSSVMLGDIGTGGITWFNDTIVVTSRRLVQMVDSKNGILLRSTEKYEDAHFLSLRKCSRNSILISSKEKILLMYPSTFEMELVASIEKNPNGTFIYQFFSFNNKWFVVSNTGVYELDYRAKTLKKLRITLPNGNNLIDIHQVLVQNTNWWLATNGAGLVKWSYSQHETTQWTTEDGLSSNVLYACSADDQGFLWLSCNYGIMRFDENTSHIEAYNTKNGLPCMEYNRTSWHKTRDGKMYFGGINGLAAFHPDSIAKPFTRYNAPLQLIRFQQYNEPQRFLEDKTRELRNTKTIRVTPTHGYFALKCKLLDYQNDEKHYSYRFVELDSQWQNLLNDQLQIGDLPYGNYTLEIRGKNQQGQYSTQKLQYAVVVIRPYYAHTWFYLSLLALFIILMIYFIRFRTYRLKREQLRLKAKVDHQTAELLKSLKEKEVLLKEVHHRVKNNLQIISSLLHLERTVGYDSTTMEVLQEARQRIKSMALVHKNLYQYDDLSQINIEPYLNELLRGLHQTYRSRNKDLSFSVKSELDGLVVDQAIPIGLILTEIVSNSYKYAFDGRQEGKIRVDIFDKGQLFELRVSDNGIGIPHSKIDETRNKSLGLKLVNLLTKQLKGRYKLTAHNGTHFIFEFQKVKD